jgi:hypothetical protein
MKEYRLTIEKNNKLSAIAKEVKLLCAKFPVP